MAVPFFHLECSPLHINISPQGQNYRHSALWVMLSLITSWFCKCQLGRSFSGFLFNYTDRFKGLGPIDRSVGLLQEQADTGCASDSVTHIRHCYGVGGRIDSARVQTMK